MRPLRLEIEGLTAFAERTVVDFQGLELFAITGPTGAGKSSLIDAMLLALFGKVPRIGKEHLQLIAHGKDQMTVLLDFAAGGAQYRVARRIRRKGAMQVQLERSGAAGPTPIAGKAKDTEAAIEQILGIDYEAFTHSVVLPQGQFDQFLRGDRKERRAILVNLLGLSHYERMGRIAGERQRDLQVRAADATRRLGSEFAAATPEQLQARRQELAAVEQQQQRLVAAAAALAAALQKSQQLDAARAQMTQAERLHTEGARRLADAESALAKAQREAASFATDRARLEKALSEVAVDDTRVQTLAAALPQLASLQRLLGERQQLAADVQAAAARVARIEAQRAAVAAQLPALETAAAEARAAVEAADAEFDQSQRAHAALHLRASLTAGEPCPVCNHPVAKVPRATKASGAAQQQQDKQQKKRDAARAALEVAEKKRHDAERTQRADDLPDAQSHATGAQQRLQRADAERQQLGRDLQTGGVDASSLADAAATTACAQRLRQEQTELQARAKTRRALQAELDALVASRRDAESRLAADTASVKLLQQQRQQLDAARTLAADATALSARELAAALAALPDGTDRPPPGAGTTAAVQQQVQQNAADQRTQSHRAGQLQEQAAQIAAAIEQAAALRAQLQTDTAASALASSLAQLLRADHFQDYVLEAAVQRLCRDGSDRLLVLSNGRYALRYDGSDFVVLDRWNADRERSVRTLSGGETFLASLALALALAEGIRTFAARDGEGALLECLFVDEGFGALDEQALEAAVGALEALQGRSRMVGVITHLEALAERLPERIAVANHGGRATVTRRA